MAAATPEFVLTALTSDAERARQADAAGVDQIGVDIERLNKRERQGHITDARISDHELDDLRSLGRVVRQARLFARLNPLHDGSRDEVEHALDAGARTLMLPYFSSASDVAAFVQLVDRRASVVLLLETPQAVVRLHDILAVDGIDEVMVGLNDLHLSMGLASHFELIVSDLMTMISEAVRARDIRFGFGGVARIGDTSLPVPADLVLAQHARLGSTSSWLSRSFYASLTSEAEVRQEVTTVRRRLAHWFAQSPEALAEERERLRRHLRPVI